MRKQLASTVLVVVVLLAIVQFAPSLLSAKEESHVQACHHRDHRGLAGA
jgi:hypothetical protein